MKRKSILILLSILSLILISCDPFVGWPEFPEKRFLDYAPYKKGDNILFENAEGDSLNFVMEGVSYVIDQRDEPLYKGYGHENLNLNCLLVNDFYRLHYSFSSLLGKRDHLSVNAYLLFDEAKMSFGKVLFETQNKSDFEEICMPDTVKITNSDDDNYCVIVNGKGLVEFSIDGKIWSLAE